jgi:3-oxoacyl-[acyl-carrier protein] reductase
MLQDKVALVTGSTAGGMGRSIALALARDGADVVLNFGTNRRGPEAEAASARVAEAIRNMGRRALVVEADTKKDDHVAAMVKKATDEFGKIDILVNNASGPWVMRDYTEIPLKEWREATSAQIDGAFLMMKYVVPGMRQRRWGRVIHLGMSGALHMTGVAGAAPDYCLGKAALGSQEFGKGITVNCVEPGPIEHIDLDEALEAATGDAPTGQERKRAGPQDVAEVVSFLCSDAGRFVSGSTIRIGSLP